MILYLIPYLITLLAAIQYDIGGHRRPLGLWNALFVYLVLLIGLRYMTGGDSYNYWRFFQDIDVFGKWNFSLEEKYQPLFLLLMSISKSIYPDFMTFQLIHALIVNVCLFYFIAKYTQYRFAALCLCFLIFYINFSIEILRESLAVFVFILNYKSLEQNKWLKYYLGVGIALLFHLSAIFLIVLPFLKWLKFDWKYLIISFMLFLVLLKISFIFSIFENIEKVNDKISNYEEASYGLKSTLLFFVVKALIPIGTAFWAKYRLKMNVKFEAMVCVYGLLGIASVFNTIIFVRFSNYLVLLYVISLTEILCPSFKRAASSLQTYLALLLCVMLFISNSIITIYWPQKYYVNWIPYYSVFSEQSQRNEIPVERIDFE